MDISGPLMANDWLNEKGGNVTLDYTVSVGAATNLTSSIRELMDITHSTLGYVYEDLY